MDNEVWKDTPLAIGYQVSSLGRIRNKNTNHIMKQMINDRGYCQTSLMISGKKKTFKVHQLVASAFLTDVNHKDGNKTNNNIDNLEYCSRKQNIIHSWQNGLSKPHDTRKKIGSE
ncbi:MAG: HNH endonuclease [Bacilli bacterium]|nr:HNH endonuclease [Bacilli bacterium]